MASIIYRIKMMSIYSKIIVYKVNIQKSIAFLYTNNELLELKKIFTLASKNNEIFRYKSNKNVQDQYETIMKTLMK